MLLSFLRLLPRELVRQIAPRAHRAVYRRNTPLTDCSEGGEQFRNKVLRSQFIETSPPPLLQVQRDSCPYSGGEGKANGMKAGVVALDYLRANYPQRGPQDLLTSARGLGVLLGSFTRRLAPSGISRQS